MFRQLHKTPRVAIVFALGLVTLLAGLFALLRMVVLERSDAQAGLAGRERVLIAHAKNLIRAELDGRMEQARLAIERTEHDPLLSCAGCWLWVSGEQVLPRLGASGRAGTPLSTTYQALRARRLDPSASTDPYEKLYRACAEHPEGSVLSWVEHRARYVVPATEEVASLLAVLHDCQPSGPLARSLLRDGVDVPGARHAEGLMPLVLRHLPRLSQADAAFATGLTVELAKKHGIKSDDFVARLAEAQSAPLDLPTHLDAPSLVVDTQGTYWYLAQSASGTRGVDLDLDAMLAGIVRHLKQAGLLYPDDHISLGVPKRGAVAARDLGVSILSPQTQVEIGSIRRRFAVKLGLLALCGSMGVALAVLGVLLQQRRQRVLALKSDFVAGVSHELRTPLASMRIIAETLARRTAGNPNVRDYPERLLRDIDGMSFLVENILSFNRLTKGRWQPQLASVRLAELVQVAGEAAQEHGSRSLRVTPDLGAAAVEGDPELLRLLFRNLYTNAIIYNARDPVEIAISARAARPRGWEVLFGDNGVGIALADRDKIFDEFYRGQKSTMARGSGLGLALCRKVMTLHGGTITVKDTSPTGTTFCLRFP